MAWTYDASLLGTTSTGADDMAVRFLIGDTDTTDQQFDDDEIAYLLTAHGGIYDAASNGSRALAAKYARQADKAVGDLKVSASQRSKMYLELADELQGRTISEVVPFAGGISIAGKDAEEDDTDRVEPAFKRGMWDHPESAQPGGTIAQSTGV